MVRQADLRRRDRHASAYNPGMAFLAPRRWPFAVLVLSVASSGQLAASGKRAPEGERGGAMRADVVDA